MLLEDTAIKYRDTAAFVNSFRREINFTANEVSDSITPDSLSLQPFTYKLVYVKLNERSTRIIKALYPSSKIA